MIGLMLILIGMEIALLTLLGALFYSMFIIFAGLSGGKINDWLAAVMFNGIGSLVPLAIYLASSAKGKTTWKGVVYAGIAGVGIMLFSIVLARIFSRGGNISFVAPAIYGTVIMLTSAFGWLVLKEKVTGLQGLGLALILVGVICVIAAKLRTA
ncbi:MAG: hypothetical protein JWL85_683 [Candidatus Saccharibacteria bacterium]|nr:hypothetical protein [Candidatus Saccharibacteria bacterium]